MKISKRKINIFNINKGTYIIDNENKDEIEKIGILLKKGKTFIHKHPYCEVIWFTYTFKCFSNNYTYTFEHKKYYKHDKKSFHTINHK